MCKITKVSVDDFMTYSDESSLSSPSTSSTPGKSFFAPKFSLSSSSDSVEALIKGLDLNRNSLRKKKSKLVKFDSTIHMVLIPSREEYYDANLDHRLWYNAKELNTMEREAIVSVSLGHFCDKFVEEN